MILTDETEEELLSDYRKSSQRLIFLDYDGTLTPFFDKPEDAKPGGDVLGLLESLAAEPGNEVVLISGRDKDTMESWFDIDAGLAAEHGAWIKERGGQWETIVPQKNDWKGKIRPILERHVDRAPGSFVEEKESSLAWHYRRVEPELGPVKALELIDDLKIADTLGLQMLNVSKVIEVHRTGINKGMAALRWIEKKDWDFILAIGDDWTDEDTFGALPVESYSIKVGPRPSQARFSLDSYPFVLWLLKELVKD
jgi:trehalose 6-phosphate synthase/phosphatase